MVVVRLVFVPLGVDYGSMLLSCDGGVWLVSLCWCVWIRGLFSLVYWRVVVLPSWYDWCCES